ncbi:8969_t:CDS:2 [Rhizophagus irregularis]|nr:8969_t:CDS:2 [Rhizophagus irregularis]
MFDTARIKIEEDLGVIDWKPNFKSIDTSLVDSQIDSTGNQADGDIKS